MRKVHIIGGGTVSHIRPHLALCAPAYGKTVRDLYQILLETDWKGLVYTYTTKMAGNRKTIWQANSGVEDVAPENLETNADVAKLLERIVADPESAVVFLPAALCDFDVIRIDSAKGHASYDVGKKHARLRTSEGNVHVTLSPAMKVIQAVRKTRKDIFLVGFKTTVGATRQDQFDAGLALVKQASCNLVLANDLVTRWNMVVTPEQAPHYVTEDRRMALRGLVSMAMSRSLGHFTRSEVHEGTPVVWGGDNVPTSLRAVVDHCIQRGAYKPFLGKTVGHFAYKVDNGVFVTSRRGVNFNELEKVGMVMVLAKGENEVIAMGAKPSVGGQSQRIIFAQHPTLDCIVHFHCPLRPEAQRTRVMEKFGLLPESVEIRSQEPYECGSHECGQNTSDGLKSILVDKDANPMLKAVMLDKHGPNIVFNKNIDPKKVIDFIERHWDLERSTSEVE